MNFDHIPKGGLAFPSKIVDGPLPAPTTYIHGMTLRSYAAVAAMQGMNSNPDLFALVTSGDLKDGTFFERMAKKAVEQADALIAELMK